MSHPFFDSVNYPWHRRDAQDLHRTLWTTVTNVVRIDQLYRSAGSGLLPLPLPPISSGSRPSKRSPRPND
jgi:hypothetical protein